MWDAWPEVRAILLSGLAGVVLWAALVALTTWALRNRR